MANTVQPIEMVELKWSKSEMEVNVKQSFSEKEVEFMTKLVQEGFNIKDSLYFIGDDVAGIGVMSENENMLVTMYKDSFELNGFLLENGSNSIIAYYADEKDQEKFYKLDLDLKRVFELLGFTSEQLDNYESDLYVLKNEISTLVVNVLVDNKAEVFMSEIDKKLWFDIPFAYNNRNK